MNPIKTHIPHRIRFALGAAAFLALLLAAPTAVFAYKLLLEMDPERLQASGFAMKVENREDGTVAFTLTRDLAKAQSYGPDSDLQVRRSATLKVSGKSGLIAECNIEPTLRNDTLTYRFAIAREAVATSHLTLGEIDDYKDEIGEGLIGGGTYFEFALALFAPQPPHR